MHTPTHQMSDIGVGVALSPFLCLFPKFTYLTVCWFFCSCYQPSRSFKLQWELFL